MKTHIIAAMMALIFTGCASHHRSVASVNKAENETQAQEHGIDSQNVRDFGNAGGLR
ncbi:MAG: hypothetical protein ACJ76H_16315 [Bacteriovoracaceae bacterium]